KKGDVVSFLLPTPGDVSSPVWGESPCGEKKSPAHDGSESEEQRQISRFSLFFFLPRLIPPKIDC
ncbi:hypothetical protein GW17_00010922, partial [Ensete ventricosum]